LADRSWNGLHAYADSKLFDAALAAHIARKWLYTSSNAVELGWVTTKMGGPAAPEDLSLSPVI
jgi:hypothetical protein